MSATFETTKLYYRISSEINALRSKMIQYTRFSPKIVLCISHADLDTVVADSGLEVRLAYSRDRMLDQFMACEILWLAPGQPYRLCFDAREPLIR